MRFFVFIFVFMCGWNFCFSENISSKILVRDYYIGQYQAKVVPTQIFSFSMPELGKLSHLNLDKFRILKGESIGRINAQKIDEESRELELKISAEKITQRKSILQLVRQKEEIEYILSLTPEEKESFSQSSEPADKRSLELLNEQIKLAEEQLVLFEEKLRSEFSRKLELYNLKAPFSGRIQYHFSLPKAASEILVLPAGSAIVTIADDSDYFIAINITQAGRIRMSPENLILKVENDSQKPICGVFSHKRIEKQNQNEILIYFFKISDVDKEYAFDLLGSNLVAKLYFRSALSIRCFSKKELVSEKEETSYRSWDDLLQKKYPNDEIVFIGETQVGLMPANTSVKK